MQGIEKTLAALAAVAAFGIGCMVQANSISALLHPYRVMWVIAVMVGSVASLPAVWSFADVANGLMAVPNLIALIGLSGVAVAETRSYLWEGNLDRAGPAATDLR